MHEPPRTPPRNSKRAVEKLSKQSDEYKEDFLLSAVSLGLPNLVRCALEAGVLASSRSRCVVARPALVQAAFDGHTRIVKQLLEAGADHSLPDSHGSTRSAQRSCSEWPPGLRRAALGRWSGRQHL